MTIHALVDADPLVYRAAWAAQRYIRWAVLVSNTSGDMKRIKHHCLDRDCYYIVPKGWSAVETGLDLGIGERWLMISAMDAMMRKAVQDHPVRAVYLSGPSSELYRQEIACVRPYKGNRTGERPKCWQAARDYLQERYDAHVTSREEADDAISIEAWRLRRAGEGYLVSSVDKDLEQVPGWHYDYVRDVSYLVTREEGEDRFWQQVLSGDGVDNVPGICGIGKIRAKQIVEDWRDRGLDEEQRFRETCTLFADSKANARKTCAYKGSERSAEQLALEMARLVYLQQKPGELWTPPSLGGMQTLENLKHESWRKCRVIGNDFPTTPEPVQEGLGETRKTSQRRKSKRIAA